MTRKRWADVRGRLRATPELLARRAAAKTELEADLVEYEVLQNPVLDIEARFADIKKRREALEDKHPEWFEDR